MRILFCVLLLKLLEISVITFIPYWIGCLVDNWLLIVDGESKVMTWLLGVAAILIALLVVVSIALVIPAFLEANYYLATQILGG
jgi:hypothetical protein